MSEQPPLANLELPRTFYGKHRPLLLAGAATMFVIFLWSLYLMLVPGHIPRALRWPIFVTSPLLTLWNWNQAQRVYLVISRLGITYHEMGYSVRTSWGNIVHIGRLPGHSAEQGIWLRHPALVVNRRFRWLLAPGEIDGRFIPLDRFVVPDEMLAQPLLAAAQPAA